MTPVFVTGISALFWGGALTTPMDSLDKFLGGFAWIVFLCQIFHPENVVFFKHIWVFPKIGVPQNGWFIRENPIRFGGTPIFGNIHIGKMACLVSSKPRVSDRHHQSSKTNRIWEAPNRNLYIRALSFLKRQKNQTETRYSQPYLRITL